MPPSTELVDENRYRPVVITFECAQNHLEVIKTQISGSCPGVFDLASLRGAPQLEFLTNSQADQCCSGTFISGTTALTQLQ